MQEVFINAKNFRNDTISLMFGKDLISVEELVDKIYELDDILDETRDELATVKEELRMTERELSSLKLGGF